MYNITNTTSICETSYTGKVYLTDLQIHVLLVLNVLVMVPNFILNAAVIYALNATKQLRNISFKLIMYLSISDCVLAATTQMLFTIMLGKYSDQIYCNFETSVEFFAIFLTHTSGYIIAVIAFDRYARMKYLNGYSKVMTTKRLRLLMVIVLLLSIIQAMVYVLGTQLNFFSKAKKVTVGIDAGIAITVFILYLMTIKAVRDHKNQANFQSMLQDVNKIVTKIASRILFAIVIFYVSYIIISMVHSMNIDKFTGASKQWLEFSLLLGYILTYCNSLVNALIFLNANNKAKRKILELFVVIHDEELSTTLANNTESCDSKL